MILWDLNGVSHNVQFRSEDYPMRPEGACKSKLQFYTGQKLRQALPFEMILEEFKIPGHLLYVDFFLPHRKIAIEIQGKQHQVYTEFFHKTKGAFNQAVNRDDQKRQWCELNKIELILIYNEKDLEDLV